MHLLPEGDAARRAGANELAAALQASRNDTLRTFAAFERSPEGLSVPMRESLNPPLWELGHIGWFQAFWLERNPDRARGASADPAAPRSMGRAQAHADALYNSSLVAHDTRWTLPLPDANTTRADLAGQLDATLALLRDAGSDDAALYFFRLTLLHEDMHHEAALHMAQSLGVAIDDARWQPAPLGGARVPLAFDAGSYAIGRGEAGFAFDNERAEHVVALPATQIDSRVLSWAEYLPFVEATGCPEPRYTRRDGGAWQQWRHGRWQTLDLALPACHLALHEAEAWCRWAGRRLPTEAEWERAATLRADRFEWGQVWEWTASPFVPYPGFEPHPYRDYSAPWFGSHRVLRGASFMTQPRMRHARYRNFYLPHRNDVPAGFRSCAL